MAVTLHDDPRHVAIVSEDPCETVLTIESFGPRLVPNLQLFSSSDVAEAIQLVTSVKSVSKATHPAIIAWRVRLPEEDQVDCGFSDCGERGAGRRLLRVLEERELTGVLVAVTRWYGGSPLGSARFRAVASVARAELETHSDAKL